VPYSHSIFMPVEILTLNKLCLIEVCSKVNVGEKLSDAFPIKIFCFSIVIRIC
jgi:hypothetical protein